MDESGGLPGFGATSQLDSYTTWIVAQTLLAIATLPTSDPAVVGELWLNSGVVTVSAGA